ncbi:hypothetical protein SLS64_011690 [Diaporthe eres]
MIHNIPQPDFEEFVHQKLRVDPNTEVRKGVAFVSCEQGWANDRLLDSYQAERRHVALVNSAQSVKNGTRIFSFLKALGIAGINDVEVARANLARSIRDPEKQQMIAEEVEAQREHFDNVRASIPSKAVHSTDSTRTARDPHRLCLRD